MHSGVVPAFIAWMYHRLFRRQLFAIAGCCQLGYSECPDFRAVVRNFILCIPVNSSIVKRYFSSRASEMGAVGHYRTFRVFFPLSGQGFRSEQVEVF